MIFGKIKMLITVLMITGLAGAGMYVMKLRSVVALSSSSVCSAPDANSIHLAAFLAPLLNILVQTFKKDLNDLDKRFNKKKRDVGKLAIQRPESIERIFNKGAQNAARCIELASGAEHTEEELKATLKSQINPECPALANPNFVHYE